MPEEDAARPTRPFPDRRSGGGQTPDAATAAAETVAALFDAVPPALEGLYSFIVRERDLGQPPLGGPEGFLVEHG